MDNLGKARSIGRTWAVTAEAAVQFARKGPYHIGFGVFVVSILLFVGWLCEPPPSRLRSIAMLKGTVDALEIQNREGRSVTPQEHAELILRALGESAAKETQLAALVVAYHTMPNVPDDQPDDRIRWHFGLLDDGNRPMTDRELEELSYLTDVLRGEYDDQGREKAITELVDLGMKALDLKTNSEFEEQANQARMKKWIEQAMKASPVPAAPQQSPPERPETEPLRVDKGDYLDSRQHVEQDQPRGHLGIEREAQWMKDVLEHLEREID